MRSSSGLRDVWKARNVNLFLFAHLVNSGHHQAFDKLEGLAIVADRAACLTSKGIDQCGARE
jgi:hypothetical protein